MKFDITYSDYSGTKVMDFFDLETGNINGTINIRASSGQLKNGTIIAHASIIGLPPTEKLGHVKSMKVDAENPELKELLIDTLMFCLRELFSYVTLDVKGIHGISTKSLIQRDFKRFLDSDLNTIFYLANFITDEN